MQPGKIFLIPSFLGEDNPAIITDQIKNCVQELNEFIVEDARTARRYLRAIGFKKDFDTEVTIHELDKHAKQQNCKLLFEKIIKVEMVVLFYKINNLNFMMKYENFKIDYYLKILNNS